MSCEPLCQQIRKVFIGKEGAEKNKKDEESPCFGLAEPNVNEQQQPKTPKYTWLTYRSIWSTVRKIGIECLKYITTLSSSQNVDVAESGRHDAFALTISSSPLFYCVEFACCSVEASAAGIDPSWPIADTKAALEIAEAETLFVDESMLHKFTASSSDSTKTSSEMKTLKRIIVLINHPFVATATTTDSIPTSLWGVPVSCYDFLSSNTNTDMTTRAMVEQAAYDNYTTSHHLDQATLPCVKMLSSGTSGGRPKGISICAATWLKRISELDRPDSNTMQQQVAVSMYSSAWATDKTTVWRTFFDGGQIGFVPVEGRVNVWPYLRVIQPTAHVVLVPALLMSLLDEHDAVLAQKLQHAQHLGTSSPLVAKAHAEAAIETYQHIGGRVKQISSGGAKVPFEVLHRLSCILGTACSVHHLYGTSETGYIGRSLPGETILHAEPGVSLRLKPRPDLAFGKSEGKANIGELMTKRVTAAKESDWFSDPETLEGVMQRYEQDGFVCTGDLAELQADQTSFSLVGRASSIVKLNSGRFFSPEKVESAIGSFAPKFSGVLICAEENTVLMLLEPSNSDVRLPLSPSEVDEFLSVAQKRCLHGGIPPSETPRALVCDEWSNTDVPCGISLWRASGCYTGSGKLTRSKVLLRMAERIKLVQKEKLKMESSTLSQKTGGGENAQLDPRDALAKELLAFVGIPCRDENAATLDSRLSPDLGFDSLLLSKLLGCVRHMMMSRWGVAIDWHAESIRSLSPRELAAWMLRRDVAPEEGEGADESTADDIALVRPTQRQESDWFTKSDTDVLEPSPEQLYSSSALHAALAFEGKLRDELQKLVLLQKSTSVEGATATQATNQKQRCNVVFLTGATGFLGRFLLGSLLRSTNISRVVCLVRSAVDIPSAKQRLLRSVTDFGPLTDNELAKIEAVMGSIDKPRLGLDEATFKQCAASCTLIIHAAAVVKLWPANIGLAKLFAPNAQSAIEIVALSTARRNGNPIPVALVSTLSVEGTYNCPTGGTLWSSVSDVPHLGDLDAYGTTKLLGEIALLDAAKRLKVPLKILRPALITPSSHGIANSEDWFLRYLETVHQMQLAVCPESVGHNTKILFSPVDEAASMMTQQIMAFLSSEPSIAPSVQVDYTFQQVDQFCVAQCLELFPNVAVVPFFAFSEAARAIDPAPPFLPLLDALGRTVVDRRSTTSSSSGNTTTPFVPLPEKLRHALKMYFGIKK